MKNRNGAAWLRRPRAGRPVLKMAGQNSNLEALMFYAIIAGCYFSVITLWVIAVRVASKLD